MLVTQQHEDLCFQGDKDFESEIYDNPHITKNSTDPNFTKDAGPRENDTIFKDTACKTDKTNAHSEDLDENLTEENNKDATGSIAIVVNDDIDSKESQNGNHDHVLTFLNTPKDKESEQSKQIVASQHQRDFNSRIKSDERNDKFLKVVQDLWTGENAYIGLTDDFLIKFDANTRKLQHWIITVDGRGEEYEDAMRRLQKMPPIYNSQHQSVLKKLNKLRVMITYQHIKEAYRS